MIETNGSQELQFVIVMDAEAADDQVEDVLARLAEAGASARVAPGRETTVIGAIGDQGLLGSLSLDGIAGVDRVQPVSKPYKLVSRETSPESTVIQARGRRIGGDYFGLIAGPCTVESREQTLATARACCAAARSSRAPPPTASAASAPTRWRSSPRRVRRPACRSSPSCSIRATSSWWRRQPT
jgi:hypothetical protein